MGGLTDDYMRNLEGQIVCHCSGAISSAVFSEIDQVQAFGYSIHPLFAVSSKLTSNQQLSNAYFTIEGSPEKLALMKELIESMGNPVGIIDASKKVLYQLYGNENTIERNRRKAMKHTVETFRKAKQNHEKIAMLTAYDYSTARLMDEAGIHGILVGDSLGNVILGYEDTISVTMEDMIHHGKAVAQGARNALVVIDMPFMSYQTSVYDAVFNAGRLMKEGRGNAVKLEGGNEICPQIKAITAAGIPVMAHLGLTPQSINAFGGFKVQGNQPEAAQKILADAKAVADAGAFAVVLECVPAKLAKLVTESLSIPTIGIGAGADCDGQVLVYQDMLGMYADFTPRFVKKYAQLGETMKAAFKAYIQETGEGIFPSAEHQFQIKEETLRRLYGNLDNKK